MAICELTKSVLVAKALVDAVYHCATEAIGRLLNGRTAGGGRRAPAADRSVACRRGGEAEPEPFTEDADVC